MADNLARVDLDRVEQSLRDLTGELSRVRDQVQKMDTQGTAASAREMRRIEERIQDAVGDIVEIKDGLKTNRTMNRSAIIAVAVGLVVTIMGNVVIFVVLQNRAGG